MSNDRREFLKIAGTTAAVAGGLIGTSSADVQTAASGQFREIKALAFDSYGTLYDVFSVTTLCDQLFPGKGNQLAQTWRAKQLQYSLLRTTNDIISVEEVKVFKTSPRVYNLAPERLKVANPELGFISANSWDICGAASAGLRTFWIQRSAADVPEELGFKADVTVKAITDLAPLLRS